MTLVTLYHIDPSQNIQRFYYMDIRSDLFGNKCPVRVWDSIGRHGRRCGISPYPSDAEAELMTSKLIATKQRKGYVQQVM